MFYKKSLPLKRELTLVATFTILVQLVVGVPAARFGLDDDDLYIDITTEADEAVNLKEQANQMFNATQYDGALSLYTEAINRLQNLDEFDKESDNIKLIATLFYNTALVYARTNRIELAIEACTKAIGQCQKRNSCLDYIKPYAKRAELYSRQGEYDQAMADYKYLLNLSKEIPTLNAYGSEVSQQINELESIMAEQNKNNAPEDYYQILGVKNDATQAEIKKAYRIIALEHHPDKNHSANKYQQEMNEKKFKAANMAHQILSDPIARAEYDYNQRFNSFGQQQQQQQQTAPPSQQWNQPSPFNDEYRTRESPKPNRYSSWTTFGRRPANPFWP